MKVASASSAIEVGERPSIWALAAYFLRLGTFGFGGPIALAANMQRDLVDLRRWISQEEYLEGLALAQLAPGPLAAQLAMYLGYLLHGFLGATVVAVTFVAPSFLMVVLLGEAYVRYGGLPWMQNVFYGVGAAVIGIIARSSIKLIRSTLKRDLLLWIIFAGLAISTAVTEREIVWLFLTGGLVTLVAKTAPKWQVQFAVTPVPWLLPKVLAESRFLAIFGFFAKAGLFVFGSGLAIVPFLHGGVVLERHWLTERQFLDAVAVAMITPGPVVITVAFIGFLVGGFSGATAAALGVFLPVYAIVVCFAPFYRRHSQHPFLHAFVQGVTAAAIGAIVGAVFVLGRRALHDVPTAMIAAGTFALLLKAKVPEPLIIVGAAIAGIAVKSF